MRWTDEQRAALLADDRDAMRDAISEARYDGADETERLRISRWGFDSEPWEEPNG